MRAWWRALRSQRTGADTSLVRHVQEIADAVALQERQVEAIEQGNTEAQAGVKAAITRIKACDVEELERSVMALGASMRRQAARSRALHAPRSAQTRAAARVLHRLAHLGTAGQPILVGPWIGDVGLELLYWAPFVRWFADQYRLAPAQLHVISRGGAPWYGDIAGTITDISSLYDATDYRARSAVSQRRAFFGLERDIVRRVRRREGNAALLLHPALMLRLFTPFWNGDASIQQIVRHTIPRRLPPPAVAMPPLPESFIAMQFAFSRTFEETPANRAWLDARITAVAGSRDVVWLGSGPEGDAGPDPYVPPALPRVHRIDRLLTPERFAAEQAAIVARASTFIGSYGGLSYVAPFYGVRSVAFYSNRDFFAHHRSVAEHVLGGRDTLSLAVISVADSALVGRVLERSM